MHGERHTTFVEVMGVTLVSCSLPRKAPSWRPAWLATPTIRRTHQHRRLQLRSGYHHTISKEYVSQWRR